MDQTAMLYIIEGDYGLVSLDVECIKSVLYSRVCKIPINIKIQNTLKSCALYNSPSWKSENSIVQGKFSNLLQKWKTISNLDENLNQREISDSLALTTLVTSKLGPVNEFLYWVEQRNCDEFTVCWFMRSLPFPFNYSYVKNRRNQACQLIETLYPLDTDLEVIKEFVTKSATHCLLTLSTKLGKKDFFFDDRPSTLDVIVYAYIAPLVKLPFPSNTIQSLLAMWPNLTEFVKRIDEKYFPDIKKEVKHLKIEIIKKQSDDEVSYLALLILIVSASSLVVGFAARKGFINLPRLF